MSSSLLLFIEHDQTTALANLLRYRPIGELLQSNGVFFFFLDLSHSSYMIWKSVGTHCCLFFLFHPYVRAFWKKSWPILYSLSLFRCVSSSFGLLPNFGAMEVLVFFSLDLLFLRAQAACQFSRGGRREWEGDIFESLFTLHAHTRQRTPWAASALDTNVSVSNPPSSSFLFPSSSSSSSHQFFFFLSRTIASFYLALASIAKWIQIERGTQIKKGFLQFRYGFPCFSPSFLSGLPSCRFRLLLRECESDLVLAM